MYSYMSAFQLRSFILKLGVRVILCRSRSSMVRNVRPRIMARINVRRWDCSIGVTDGKYLPWLLRTAKRVARDFQAWPRLRPGMCTGEKI